MRPKRLVSYPINISTFPSLLTGNRERSRTFAGVCASVQMRSGISGFVRGDPRVFAGIRECSRSFGSVRECSRVPSHGCKCPQCLGSQGGQTLRRWNKSLRYHHIVRSVESLAQLAERQTENVRCARGVGSIPACGTFSAFLENSYYRETSVVIEHPLRP